MGSYLSPLIENSICLILVAYKLSSQTAIVVVVALFF